MKVKKVSNTKTNLKRTKKSPKQQRRSKSSSQSLKISVNNKVQDFTDEKKLEEREDVYGQEVAVCKQQKLKEIEISVHNKQGLKEKKTNKIKMKQQKLKKIEVPVHNQQGLKEKKTNKIKMKQQNLKEIEVPVPNKQGLKENKTNKIKMKQQNLKEIEVPVPNKQDLKEKKTNKIKMKQQNLKEIEVPVPNKQGLKEKKTNKIKMKQQNLKEIEVPVLNKQGLKEKKTNKIKMKQKNLKISVHNKLQDFTDEKKPEESNDVHGQEEVSVCKQQKLKKREVPVLKKQRLKEKKRKEMKMKQKKLKKDKNVKTHESYLECSDKDATEDHSEVGAQDVESAVTKTIRKKKFEKGKLVQRSEASINISEFNLTEIGKEKVNLNELLKTLKKTTSQITVKKQLMNATKLKKLAEPLSKPRMEKIKRAIGYEKICDEVAKWDSIVRRNRLANQIVYPLKKPFTLDRTDKIAESFVSKTPLEEEVSRMLNNSENVLETERSLTVAEEKALQAMSLQEAKLRHGELMKHRALLSYQEAKARRQNKIKSKKYHRLLKKEKLKNSIKEFEILQKTDPEAAFEKFAETDKLRILERMTLKHRNTGKWAKQQKLRAKYNPESRISLKEDVILGRKLKEKLRDVDISLPVKPTVTNAPTVSTNDDPVFDSRHDVSLIEDTTSHSGFISNEINVTNLRHNIEPDASAETATEDTNEKLLLCVPETSYIQRKKLAEQQKKKEKQDLGFSTEVTFLDSMVPDDITAGDENIDDVESDVMNIRQAFADEGLIAEFREEKKAADEANKLEGIDMFLPGWGSWGGPSIQASARKRKRFFIEPVVQPKKKNTLGNVIINEDNDKKAAVHQVSHLPFPFTKVHQFESYIRQPIGNTWNPETSFHKLITPKVVTKLGKIIDPVDADDVILEKKEDKRPQRGFWKPKEVTAF